MKSKDLEMGKEIKGWKNEKMKNIEDFTLLAVLECNTLFTITLVYVYIYIYVYHIYIILYCIH